MLHLRRVLIAACGALFLSSLPTTLGQQATMRKSDSGRQVFELIESLKQPGSTRAHREAIESLAARGPRITSFLVSELSRGDRYSFVPMIYLLGRVGDPSSRQVLWDVVRRERGVTRLYALYALAMQGEVQAVRFAVRSNSATTSFVPGGTAMDFVAGVLGPAAIPPLLEELPNRAGAGHMAGVVALGTIADPRATPYLLELLDHQDTAVVRAALGALARIGDERAAGPATRLLGAPDPLVRETAAEALSYLKWPKARTSLKRHAMEDSSPAVKRKAVWSLAMAGGPASAMALGDLLEKSDDPGLTRTLVNALGQTGSPEAVPPLRALALGNNPDLASRAVHSLGELTIPPATRALQDVATKATDARIRSNACLALADRQPGRAAGSALDLVLSAEALSRLDAAQLQRLLQLVAREGGEQAIRQLETAGVTLPGAMLDATLFELRARRDHGDDPAGWRAMLRSDTPREVDLAVRRLGELGDEGAVNDLIRTFGRIDRRRAPLIPLALGRIGSPQAIPFLTELIANPLYATPSLQVTRQTAAWALPRCGAGEGAVPALRVMATRGGGEILPALVALAKISGTDALEDLYKLKTLIMRQNTSEAVAAHESVNWVIREIRAGRSLDRLDRPPRFD